MTRLLAMLLIAAMPAAAAQLPVFAGDPIDPTDRKSTRLNSSH